MCILGTQIAFKFRKAYVWTTQVCYSVQDSYEFHTLHLDVGIYNPYTRHKKKLMLDTFLQTND